jgi:N-acetylglucosamine kinase-like BadF-type ATPase
MEYVLAVDGGNTKTVACVADRNGCILGIGRSGCGDIYNSSAAAPHGLSAADFAIANIEVAVTQALQTAHIQPTTLTASVFNLAGADWPEDYGFLQSAMQARQFGRFIHIQNDALGVLRTGSENNVGVSLVCGTGAATGARGYDGRIWHSSFWQTVHGSASLSQQVLDVVIRAELGLEEATTLTQRVLDFFGRQTVEDVLHSLTARNQPSERKPPTNGLTFFLLEEADAGDQVARRVVQRHGHALGEFAAVAAQYVGIEQTPFTLVLAGGVFRHPTSLLAKAIIERVREASPDLHAIRSPLEPIIGVLFTALDLVGAKVDASLREQIMAIHPDLAFFITTGDGTA